MKCAVANCNSLNSECSFFNFPVNAAIKKQWINFCRRGKNFKGKNCKICMLHFTAEDFENNLQFEMGFCNKRLLKPGAVPSINNVSVGNVQLFEERAARIQKRENKKMVAVLLQENDSCPNSQQDDDTFTDPVNVLDENEILLDENAATILYVDESIYPDVKVVSYIESLKSELDSLRKENKVLKKMQKKHATEISALKDEMKKLDKIHKYEIEVMEKRLAKSCNEYGNPE